MIKADIPQKPCPLLNEDLKLYINPVYDEYGHQEYILGDQEYILGEDIKQLKQENKIFNSKEKLSGQKFIYKINH